MITPDYVQAMARYNHWQNQSLYGAADTLTPGDRITDRGAFFGSIQGTLSHLLWGDTVWMARFGGGEPPTVAIADSPGFVIDWDTLKTERHAMDARILDWAVALGPVVPEATLGWYSAVMGREVERPLSLCITHFFNHQAHHRGQVHAMLTAAGARPEDTDLIMMPETA